MEPVIASTYSFKIRLSDVAGGFKLTPTLAAGDFKISTSSIASGALTNLTNLPTETPAGSGIVVISLTAAEMADGDPIVTWKDQTTPQEWIEGYSFIDTRPSVAAVATAVADLPTNAELATSQAAADDATLAAIATLQTSVNDLPTNAELATALGTSDDATLAAIAAVESKVDTTIATANAIVAQTDQLTFTDAGHVDSNVLLIDSDGPEVWKEP